MQIEVDSTEKYIIKLDILTVLDVYHDIYSPSRI